MGYKTVEDVIEFVLEYGKKYGRTLQGSEITRFVEKLQQEIGNMDFSVPEGATVIAYTGTYNGIASYKVANKVSCHASNYSSHLRQIYRTLNSPLLS